MAANEGVSRRHVLAGVAWTTPVVVMATTLPAAAASTPVAGGVLLTDLAATMVETQFFVSGSVAYVGNGDAIADYPVTNVLVGIRIPTVRLSASTPLVLTPSWQLQSSNPDGADTVFILRWLGPGLSDANSITLPFEMHVGKTSSLDPLTLTFTGDGTSGASGLDPVLQDVDEVEVLIGANLVLDTGGSAIRYDFHDGVAGTHKYVYNGTTRWAGPYYPPGTQATDVTVTARIPASKSTGELVGQSLGSGWSLFSGPSLVAGQWRVVFKYGPALSAEPNDKTTPLTFGLVAVEPGETFVTTLRTEAIAAGTTTFDQLSGPSSVVILDD